MFLDQNILLYEKNEVTKLKYNFKISLQDLSGITIKGIIYHNPPLSAIENIDGRICFGGYFGEVWKTLEQIFHFNTSYSTSEDVPWYSEPKNGSWPTMLGKLEEGAVDVVIADVQWTPLVMEAFSLLFPLISEKMGMFIRKPDFQPEDDLWVYFTKPFSFSMWMAILLLLVLISLVLYFIYSISKKKYKKDENYSLPNCLFHILGIFCYQGQSIDQRSIAISITLFISYVTTLIIISSFSAKIISSLANFQIKLPFEDFEGLVENGEYSVGAFKGGPEHITLKTSKEEVIQTIWNDFVDPETDLVERDIDGLERACQHNYLYIVPWIYIVQIYNNVSCKTVMLPRYYSGELSSIAFKNNFRFQRLFNYEIHRMQEFGILKNLKNRAWPPPPTVETDTKFSEVNLYIVRALFYFLLMANALSIIILCIEFVIFSLINHNIV